jgi:hypothetical protein
MSLSIPECAISMFYLSVLTMSLLASLASPLSLRLTRKQSSEMVNPEEVIRGHNVKKLQNGNAMVNLIRWRNIHFNIRIQYTVSLQECLQYCKIKIRT